ncbi:MAG: YceI family protein [Myxococcota bacterium]
MHRIAPILSSLLAFTWLSSAALAAPSIEGKPKISFFATGSPGFMSIEGVTSTVTVAEANGRLTFTVPMSTVDSGITLRDEHMNDNYVEIAKFPNAVLDLAKGEVTWPTDGSTTGTVAANFTIHGVTQPVSVGYTTTKTKTGWKIKAKFDYDVSKHGITIEPYMGISFDHKMYATVTMDLVDAP